MASRKNRHYTENPYYTNVIRPTLSAAENAEDDYVCTTDPATGKVTCRVVITEGPEDPAPAPTPVPPPEPEPSPSSQEKKGPDWKGVIHEGLDLLSQILTPPEPAKADFRPTLDALYQESQLAARQPIPNPSPMPEQRPLPAAPSQAMSSAYAQTVQMIQSGYADQIQQAMARNEQAAQGRPDLASAIARQYPELIHDSWQSPLQAPTHADQITPKANPETQAKFRQVLDPQSGSYQILPETTDLHVNLQYAQTPLDWHRDMVEMAQRHADAILIQNQIEAQQAQKRYYQMLQRTEAARQALMSKGQDTSNNLVANAEEVTSDIPPNILAESGSVSIKYKPPVLGEKATGPKSKFPPKEIVFSDDKDLANKLWEHFYKGQGQPVVINMTKLDFSNSLNVSKLFSPQAKAYMKVINKDSKNTASLLQQYTGKKSEERFPVSNGKITFISFQDNFFNVSPKINPGSDKFAAFGRLKFDIQNLNIHINHANQTIVIDADLTPAKESGTLDEFNFESDSSRGWFWNNVTNEIHQKAPPGSTSFKIYGKSASHLKQQYSFKDF